jgi:hypothetical protein
VLSILLLQLQPGIHHFIALRLTVRIGFILFAENFLEFLNILLLHSPGYANHYQRASILCKTGRRKSFRISGKHERISSQSLPVCVNYLQQLIAGFFQPAAECSNNKAEVNRK